MSGMAGSANSGVTTFAAVTVAAVPKTKEALSPLFETGAEFTLVSVAIVFALPAAAVLTLLATAAKD